MEMNKEVYVVTFDGYLYDFGAYIFLLGVYGSYDKAVAAKEEAIMNSEGLLDNGYFEITKTTMNESFGVKVVGTYSKMCETEAPLGGYAE